MKRRILAMLLCFSLIMNAVPSSMFAAKLEEQRQQTKQSQVRKFKDVSPGDWYYDSIMYAVENNIFAGTSEDTFSVNDPMTRGMYVTVLGRLAKMGEDYGAKASPFSDVKPSAYYAPSVIWATEKGIAKGIGDNKFGPDSPITREQMAIFIVRFFDVYKITYPNIVAKKAPLDLEKINDYAKESVLKLWNTGLLGGDEKGNFNPKKNATRAEVAAFTVRVDQTVLKPQEDEEDPKLPKETPDKEQDKGNPSTPTGGSGGSNGGGESVQYYNITFNPNGGTDVKSKRVAGGTSIGELQIPYKDQEMFAGWYYDAGLEKPVQSKDMVEGDITLYAKYSLVTPMLEVETPSFASALDQGTDFHVMVVSSKTMTNEEIKSAITCKNISSLKQTDFIEVAGDGTTFKISGRDGFEAGASYKLTLNDDALQFQGHETSVRDYNFTIFKEEVLNLGLNQDMVYILFDELSNMTQDGKSVAALSSALVKIKNDSNITLSEITSGTFNYSRPGCNGIFR